MKDILLKLVRSIVEDEDAITVEENEADGVITLNLSVAKNDMGKIIGKEGRVIRSIRNVMKIPAIKQDKRVQITLLDEKQ